MIAGRERLQQAYRDDAVAEEYIARRFETPLGGLLHGRQAGVVQRLIRQHGIRQALEIAPGPARVTVDVAPLLESVTLLDSSAQMLAQARRRLHDRGLGTRARCVQADAFSLPIGGCFDLVYSFRLIRHFDRDDRLRLYAQAASILRPNGWLVFDAVNVVVSRLVRERSAPSEHVHFDALLTASEVRQELAESGFDIVDMIGVQRRYAALLTCQVYVAPRIDWLARLAMAAIDRTGGEPLEWVVVCRRR